MNQNWLSDAQSGKPRGIHTRLGSSLGLVAIFLFLLGGFTLMLLTALPRGDQAVHRVVVQWSWIAGLLCLAMFAITFLWARYRVLVLRLFISGVRGKFLIAQVGEKEKAALATQFENAEFASYKGLAIVVIADHNGLSLWEKFGDRPFGKIPWTEIASLKAVDTVRLGSQSPELQLTFTGELGQLSLPLGRIFPLSISTIGLSRVAKIAARLREIGGIAESDSLAKLSLQQSLSSDHAGGERAAQLRLRRSVPRLLWVLVSSATVWVVQGVIPFFFPALLGGIALAVSPSASIWTNSATALATAMFACALGVASVFTRNRALTFLRTLAMSSYAAIIFILAFSLFSNLGAGSLENLGKLTLDLIRSGIVPVQIAIPPLIGLIMRVKRATELTQPN